MHSDNSDKDLPLGDLGQIPLDDEPRTNPSRKKATPPRATAQKERRKKPPKPTPTGGSSTLPWLLFVLVLVILLAGGYWGWQQFSALQAQVNQQQNLSSSKLDSLQDHLTKTSSQADSISSKLQKTLDSQDKELTRLAANDLASRKRIAELEKSNKSLTAEVKQASGLSTQITALKNSIGKLDTQLAGLRTNLGQLEAQQKRNTAASEQAQLQAEMAASDLKTLRSTVDKQAQQGASAQQLSGDIDTLQKQLKDVKESIEAIDRWRVQVNNQLQ